jgi:hypothetical protein
MEKKFRKTSEKMQGFSFVTPVTGHKRPNTGKEDDDDNIIHHIRTPYQIVTVSRPPDMSKHYYY